MKINTEEEIDRVMKLVDKFEEPRRRRVLDMLDTETGSNYFTAPASTRSSHHSAFPGGLVHHSLYVAINIHALAKDLCPSTFDANKLTFVALFHDLGKAGDGVLPYYEVEESDWHRNRGNMFRRSERISYMEHSLGSLYLLQKHGICLDIDEFIAIKIHDGQYVEENRSYSMKEPNLALLLHWADLWACRMEKLELS